MKRIAIFDAQPDMIIAADVLGRNGQRLLTKGSRLTEQSIVKLIRYGIPTIYVLVDDSEDSSPEKEIIEIPDVIAWETRLEAEKTVQEVFRDIKLANVVNLEKPKKIVDKIIRELLKSRHIVGKLADIRILDDYTFAHSVNVCVLAVTMGMAAGYSRLRLRELGIGALLHDIGKTKVPEEILKKPTRLDDEEYRVVRQHTIAGYELLKDHPDISSNAARIALQHHEGFNGQGYPFGLRTSDIHEYAKVVAIADVYDALTADRVYKNAIYPYEAAEIIIASGGLQFDPGLVKQFVENVSIYPVGSSVLLNTGETALVTFVNRSLPTRPVVKLIADANGELIKEHIEIDLMQKTTIFVNEIISFRNLAGQ